MSIKLSRIEWEQIGKTAGWDLPDDHEEIRNKRIYDANKDKPIGDSLAAPENDDTVSRRRGIKVILSDGDYILTEINGTKKQILDYYLPGAVGEETDFNENRPNATRRPVKIEFLG